MATNTAASFTNHTGNGTAGPFNISFSYLSEAEVDVTVGGVLKTITTHYTFTSATQITFTSGNEPANGVAIKFQRDTNISAKKVDFADGSVLTEADLDANSDQVLFAQQEIIDKLGGIEEGATGDQTAAEIRTLVESATDSNVFTDADHSKLNAIEANATADQTVSEIKSLIAGSPLDASHLAANSVDSSELVDGSVDTSHLSADSVTNAKIADDSIDSEHYVDGSIDTAHIGNSQVTTDKIADSGITTAKIAADAINSTKIADDSINSEHYVDGSIDTAHIANNAVTTGKIADAELKTLAGMQSGTASKLADSTALTSDIADLNQLDGMAKQTTITDDDTKFPTSGAVVDFVAAQIAPIGGLEVIANEDSFPTTQPASGVVISISDIEGLIVNGSGVATNARTSGNGSDNVTINGFPSSLQSKTMAAGLGLMVSSTGSSQTYTYHKLLAKEADVEQLSNDINDFAARYRVTNGEPTSNNDEGDLIYDKDADKMKVFDSSTNSFKEVTSVGDYKFLFLCPAGGSGSPTINGSIATYDLREGSTSGSAASITNAAQLIVSINGVIQKPNTGTSAPSEGFAMVDSNTIIFGSNLPTGAEVFIVQIGSATTLNVPADNSVATAKIQNQGVTTAKIADANITTAKIADDAVTGAKIAGQTITGANILDGTVSAAELGSDAVTTAKLADGAVNNARIADDTITNAKINSSAAIAGSKISPDFGSQDIKTTGTIEVPTINDGQLGNRNMIINGDMQVNQRGNKTGLTSTDYAIDRFKIGITNIGTYSVSQSDNSTDTGITGCRYSLKLDCTTADASPAAADVLSISQSIEGQHMTRLAWGTSGGQKKATLSFWAKADINGFTSGTKDFVVEIQTSSSHEFSVVCQLTANSTWQKFVIVFDAFGSATLVRNNTGAATINWWLAAGSNYKGGTYSSGWQQKANTGGVRAAGLTLDLSAHTDNNFYLTAVQFELGEKATTFEHKLYQQELSLCQRYYQQLGSTNTGFGGDFAMLPAYTYNVGTRIAASFITNSKMRTTPSIAEIGNGIRVYGQGTNSDVATIFGIFTADDSNAVAFTLDGDNSKDWGDSDHAMVVTNRTGGGISFSAEF